MPSELIGGPIKGGDYIYIVAPSIRNKVLFCNEKPIRGKFPENAEFKEILKGKKKSNKYFIIFFKKLSNKNKNKLNISFVAKKKLGNAVSRNKIKRKLRNITNEILNKLSLKLDYSYLVIAKNTILKNEYADIKKTMFTEFNKIK